MKIIVGCEESQIVTKEFRNLGHEAYSCDILPCSGGHPEWHIQDDIFNVVDNSFDLGVFHPPCTYLTVTGNRWYYHPDDREMPVEERRPHPRFPNRRSDREEAVEFFMKLANLPINKIAIENPVGIMSTRWRKPDCIVQPYMFGDEASKTTCFWLKNLPPLEPTDMVGKGERVYYKSGKSHAKWYAEALTASKTAEERKTLRSKTFPGMAKAIAKQWSN